MTGKARGVEEEHDLLLPKNLVVEFEGLITSPQPLQCVAELHPETEIFMYD